MVTEFAAKSVESGADRGIAFAAQPEHLAPGGDLGLDGLEVLEAEAQVGPACDG